MWSGALSLLVIAYLFLGGAGAGALLILSLLDLCTPEASSAKEAPALAGGAAQPRNAAVNRSYRPQRLYSSFFAPGFLLAASVLVLSSLCLLFDLGHPGRVLNLFLRPTLSYLSFGTYALAAAVICGAFLAALWVMPLSRLPRKAVRCVECLGILASLVLIGYTGFLLYSMGAATLLGSLLVPLLFVLSALSCGIALLFLLAGLNGAATAYLATLSRLGRLDSLLIGLELVVLAAFVALSLRGGNNSDGALGLLQGPEAAIFFLVLVCCGLLLPLLLENMRRLRFKNTLIPASLAVLTGGFALRWWLVQVGFPAFVPGVV
ncbi:MAG: polysulfide reductase NrfD [Coriobacteriaceae bacterium]|jgi:formate-dependent nitrite reductase membrane component NrfD|nr:polysulfide reductase NrfD [Coriobacteriaceae bacterium]